MLAWQPELKELSQYQALFEQHQMAKLSKELKLICDEDKAVNVLNTARRTLEVIITDVCQVRLNRERGSEPLRGLLEKFNKDNILPGNIISSMFNVNELGKYGSHPLDFDENRQVREALLSLLTVLSWYAKEQQLTLPQSYPSAIIDQELNSPELEMVGGAIPLDSKFYVKRPVDTDFLNAVKRRDSIVLLKGSRQVGKTSLLARGLQQARDMGVKVVCTDFQKLIPEQLQSLETLFMALADMLADQLYLDVYIQDTWRANRAPNLNFDSYFRREILGKIQQPILWAMDEADRLFLCDFSSNLFALFRTWHNERALNPDSPCVRLTLAIAYATETYLFIKDPNQSPFNVGTKLNVNDFNQEQLSELNQLYGRPLKTENELQAMQQFLGGQPFLVRSAFNYMVANQMSFAQFESLATQEDGVFGDHLRRLLLILRDEALADMVRDVIKGKICCDDERFSLLRRVGLLSGECRHEAQLRCQVYDIYLRKHLF